MFVSCNHSIVKGDGIKQIFKYNGETAYKMEKKLGKPCYNEIYPLSKANDEMRSHVQQYFKKDFQYSPNINIKEIWWKDGDYYITCWFKERLVDWQVITCIRWHKNARFK